MSATAQEQVAWIQQEILDQVNAAMEQFTLMESSDDKVLQFARVVVQSVVNRIDVVNVLGIHYHLKDTGELNHIACADRIQSLYDYFYAWITLELATRYA